MAVVCWGKAMRILWACMRGNVNSIVRKMRWFVEGCGCVASTTTDCTDNGTLRLVMNENTKMKSIYNDEW